MLRVTKNTKNEKIEQVISKQLLFNKQIATVTVSFKNIALNKLFLMIS